MGGRNTPEMRDQRIGAETDDHHKAARDGRRKKKYVGVPWPF